MLPLKAISREIGLALLLLASTSVLPAGAQDDDSGFKYLEIKVLDPDGKPMTGVSVQVKIDDMKFPMPVDDEGFVSLNVPTEDVNHIELKVEEAGYVPLGASWQSGDGKKIPKKITIKMQKGLPIGGLVEDEAGKPIEGVKIKATVPSMPPSSSSNDSKAGFVRMLIHGTIAKTDREGRWQAAIVPEKPINLYLKLEHPDYASDKRFGQRRATLEQLRKLDHVFVMKKGIVIRGRVTSDSGEPLQGAKVAIGNGFREDRTVADTDEEGRYRLNSVSAGSKLVTVVVEGWSPDLRSVVAKQEMQPVDFQLEPGHSIRVRVTDPEGEPLAKVWIMPGSWRDYSSLNGLMPRGKTDEKGVWQSDSAPADEIEYALFKHGRMATRDQRLVAREEEHVIIMPNPLVVQGQVVDSKTGQPIERFNVLQGIRWNSRDSSIHWKRYNIEPGRNGAYRTEFNEPRFGHLVRLEAEGYRPEVSRLIKTDEGEVTVNFELEAGTGPSGLVKTPLGEPAEGAVVVMANAGQHVQIDNGQHRQRSESPSVVADAEGRFTLPFPEGNYSVVILHESGGHQLDGKKFEASSDITLEPWARVEGKLMRGKEPWGGERVYLNFSTQYQQGQPRVYWLYQVQTAEDGSFTFDQVRAHGTATVSRYGTYANIGDGRSMGYYTHGKKLQLEPGKTLQVQIGGEGRTLKGRLVVPDDYEGQVVWDMGHIRFGTQTHRAVSRTPFYTLGKALAQLLGHKSTLAAKPDKPVVRRNYTTSIVVDGTFEIYDVMPGQYQMNVQLLEYPEGGNYNWEPIGTLSQAVTVPEAKNEAADEPLDLGEHALTMLKPKSPQATGDTVEFPVITETPASE